MIFTEEYQRRLAVWSDIQDHLEYLYATVCSYEKPVVVELGVRSGNSTAAFLAGVEAAGGHLWSCDIEDPDVPQEWLSNPLWTFIKGDDVLVQNALPEAIDVLFIDTSHEYGHTLEELRVYEPRVNPGGIVLCHDTQWEYPSTSLPDASGPVAGALDAYCREAKLTWANRNSDPGFYGLGVIPIGAPDGITDGLARVRAAVRAARGGDAPVTVRGYA